MHCRVRREDPCLEDKEAPVAGCILAHMAWAGLHCARVHRLMVLETLTDPEHPSPGAAGATASEVRAARKAAGVLPSFKRVDTCAAEFAAETPYLYSSYDGSDESRPSSAKKVPPLLRRVGVPWTLRKVSRHLA